MALPSINTGPQDTQLGDPSGSASPDLRMLSGSALYTNTIAETTSGSGVTIDGALLKDGELVVNTSGKRNEKIATIAVTGGAFNGVFASWQNPESTAVIITRAILDVTTVATGACTLDIGVTPTSATTGSDTLLDGIDVNAATAVFDSMNAALDTGTNAKAQKLAAGKWVTVEEKTGDCTGLVGTLYIMYITL